MTERPVSDLSLRPQSADEIRSAFLKFFAAREHRILPSASLVPEDPTVLLTIAGMLPFKPVFLGQQERPAARVATSQKCIRTNDIENVGRTARHHTFFEMLGNFSFGDYFKKEAIQWAWELSTEVYKLDPKNLVISVFREDDESELIWRDVVGVNPKRIIRMDEADNFWSSGLTGPCGPCSEIYYDFQPELGDDLINLEDDNRFIEFYNLVFMQYNRDSTGMLEPLATCNIDTGMGLERMAQILQGVPNNYETDLIYPLIQKAAQMAGLDYLEEDKKNRTSLKVIGDHIRAASALLSDGVVASNLGRGYVLRRLIRRIIRHGRLIGIKDSFLAELGATAIQTMTSVDRQLLKRREFILKELRREEERFLLTLDRGEKLLSDLLESNPKEISGVQAFELYDTYGFPLELTEEIAQENNISVDTDAFEQAMQEQRQRAKDANIPIDLTIQNSVDQLALTSSDTKFLGYEKLKHQCLVQGLIVNGKLTEVANEGDKVDVILDRTSFYGEGGGQIGDSGTLTSNKSNENILLVDIETVTRSRQMYVHRGYVQKGCLKIDDEVITQVNCLLRSRAQVNHTATHLLQSALKQIVDPDISQAGSLVDFDHLRFDFHCSSSIRTHQLIKIEELINRWIAESHVLEVQQMSIEDAKASGAVAMFGEKYGDVVRVVNVPGVSMELCGGTHVSNTSELGLFKITSEAGIAAGIRRIEAVAGPSVLEYLNERDLVVKQLGDIFKAQAGDIVDRVISLQDELKNTTKALLKANEELAIAKALSLINKAIPIGSGQHIVQRVDGFDAASLQTAAKYLIEEMGIDSAIILAGLPDPKDLTKVVFLVAFGSGLVGRGLNAGKFIGPIAQRCDGGGGGRRNVAQAGGRDGSKLNAALDLAIETLSKSLS